MGGFIDFITENNLIIIFSVATLLSMGAAYLVYRSVRYPDDEANSRGNDKQSFDVEKLEQTLKSVLEQTKVNVAAPLPRVDEAESPAEGSAGEAVAVAPASAAAGPVTPQAQEDVKKYLEKIDDLEGRLAEYEILEDDIADLSLFKEENSKLKTENQGLKASLKDAGESAAKAPAAPPPKPEPGPEPGPEPNMAATAEQAIEETEIPPEEPVEAAAQESNQGDADAIVEEFAKALEDEPSAAEAQAPAPVVAEETAVADAPSEMPPPDEKDDILAEFLAEIDDGSGAAEGQTKKDESVNTDKMMAEMNELSDLEGEAQLETDVDTDKMATEATKLNTGE